MEGWEPVALSIDGARREVSESGLIIEFEEVGPEICLILLAVRTSSLGNGDGLLFSWSGPQVVKVIGDDAPFEVCFIVE